jgi:hypothetical protein
MGRLSGSLLVVSLMVRFGSLLEGGLDALYECHPVCETDRRCTSANPDEESGDQARLGNSLMNGRDASIVDNILG